jgi:hypothetical protein
MTHLFKSNVQQLRQTVKSFQAAFKDFIMNFVENDIDGMENDAARLYQQGRLLDGTLFSILNRSSPWERTYWNRQNQHLVNGICHSRAAMNCLLGKLKELFYETNKGLVSDSSVYALAIFWHTFVSSLKETLRDLEQETARRKRSTSSKCLLNG